MPASPWLVAADLLDPRPEPFAADPVGFARTRLGFSAWSKQAEIMEAVRDHARVAVRSSHGPGKTATAAQIALWFLKTHRNSRVITTAPTWKQVEQLLWVEIRAAVTKANGLDAERVFPSPGTAKLELGEQWFAIGLSTNEPERFQGHHAPFLLLVVDEASGVDERIFEAAEGFQTAEGAHMLLVGNPTKVGGQFHRAFTTERAAWKLIHISTFDTPNYTGEPVPLEVARSLPRKGWAEEKRLQWGEASPMYQVRVLGNFPSQASDAVLALHTVEAAQARTVDAVVDQQPAGSIVIACDVARYGDDETVITTRIGDQVRIAKTYIGKATTETTGWIIETARPFLPNVRIVVDDAGVGGGVTDQLRERGWSVAAFNGAERAFNPDAYPNRRSELWYALADRLDELDLDPDEQLAADLTGPTFRLDSAGRRVVEPKADTKKRLGRSPDRGDAVLLTLVPPTQMPVLGQPEPGTADDELGLTGENFFETNW